MALRLSQVQRVDKGMISEGKTRVQRGDVRAALTLTLSRGERGPVGLVTGR